MADPTYDLLPDGCRPGQPLRTRAIEACGILEEKSQRFLYHLTERGRPEEADPAQIDLCDQYLDEIHAASLVLRDVLDQSGAEG